jgi:hypothetical protein
MRNISTATNESFPSSGEGGGGEDILNWVP